MKTTITTESVPIKLWLEDIEAGTLQQAKNLANLPFAFHHIAIMPDAHFGYGMPIGGVMATDEVIIPNAVGVDIGCGVCAMKTSLSSLDKTQLKEVMKAIRKAIPLGFKHHAKPLPKQAMPASPSKRGDQLLKIVRQEYESGRKQIGTLGGGNHFIEFQQAPDRSIWVMVHSGSRNLGFKVANHYNKVAVSLNKKRKSPVPPSWQLAGLSLESTQGQAYLEEMNYCVSFAKTSRRVMITRIKEILVDTVSTEITFEPILDVAHNYAALETHFGKKVMVHRKGATRAFSGELGIIPGSQGTSSYIVCGKGNPESFRSCSHGAGRRLGRKQAQKQLDLDQEKKRLERKGILHAIRGKRDLEEAAGAYKDIEQVMSLQEDLVEIKDVLQPLAVIKG